LSFAQNKPRGFQAAFMQTVKNNLQLKGICVMSFPTNSRSRDFFRRFCILTFATTSLLAGCGGGSNTVPVVPNPSLPTGLPTPAAAGPVNTYSGAQSPGAWTVTLDNTKNIYTYQSITYPASPISGSLQVTNGFTKLSSSGYALEIQGRAVILRPGDVTAPLVFAVPQTGCYQITGKLRFQYMGMQVAPSPPVPYTGPILGYGSIVASTDSTGKSWQFENLQGNIVSGPGTFTGTCSSTNNQNAISFTGQTLLNNYWSRSGLPIIQETPTSNTQSNIWIGPSGFFVADQSDPTATAPTGASMAGVAEPSSALSTTDMASKTYLGFIYEPAATINSPSTTLPVSPATSAVTSPVAFGQVASSGTTMTGGIFPNDDVTQAPASDTMINLGKEDATYNGLYTAVSITVPDPDQNCANYTNTGITATSGINAQGYITCTFPGIAIAGNPEGKYALFISTYNWASRLGGVPMQFYLFQQ
jgi:hypothetical protein